MGYDDCLFGLGIDRQGIVDCLSQVGLVGPTSIGDLY
jgi:hypothetical protein